MKEFLVSVTARGQVTILKEVRERLSLDSPGKVSFVIGDDGGVRMRAPRFPTIESLRGIAGSLDRPMSWDEMLTIAHEDAAAELVEGKRG